MEAIPRFRQIMSCDVEFLWDASPPVASKTRFDPMKQIFGPQSFLSAHSFPAILQLNYLATSTLKSIFCYLRSPLPLSVFFAMDEKILNEALVYLEYIEVTMWYIVQVSVPLNTFIIILYMTKIPCCLARAHVPNFPATMLNSCLLYKDRQRNRHILIVE
ncbi:hypothetical protein L596_012173 [Steinernema carpocapsae]|uniref:Uncharacterized protein n=1 Tax=Steinernema carpocapsae TaxID=34508 RepID=A0A4U5NWH0_STECR|nr:hypothetical protein L596_012173 [Steinernema carpocapsae]